MTAIPLYSIRVNSSEIATSLTALCREGKFLDAVDAFYADDVVSLEAMDFLGQGREMRGKAAVKEKNARWFEDNDIQGVQITGPFISPEGFALVFAWNWTRKATGEQVKLSEVGVYTVANSRIVREEFLYGAG